MQRQGKKLHVSRYVVLWADPSPGKRDWCNPHELVVVAHHLVPLLTFNFNFVLAPSSNAQTEMNAMLRRATEELTPLGLSSVRSISQIGGSFEKIENSGGLSQGRGLKGSDREAKKFVKTVIAAFGVRLKPFSASVERQYLVRQGDRWNQEGDLLLKELKEER
jgi:hypothetical protein